MTSTKPDWRGERRDAPSLPEVVHVLGRRRLLVAGVALVLAGAALLAGLYRTPFYVAEATVGIALQEEAGDDEASEAFVRAVQIAVERDGGGGELRREAMRRAGWDAGLQEFNERLDVSPSTGGAGTGLVVRFVGREPGGAARAANAYAAVFAREVRKLDGQRLPGGMPIAQARVEAPAAAPPERSRGALPLLYAVAAAGAGLLLGGAAAMLLEGRARGWRGVQDAELTLRAPVLGAIPDYSPGARGDRLDGLGRAGRGGAG